MIITKYTNIYRFLIKHGTGLGKTISALKIIENFINTNNIFILTHNKEIFTETIIFNKLVQILP